MSPKLSCIYHVCLIDVQVSSLGVTGTRASVSDKVQALLREIKEVCLLKQDLDSMLQKYDTQS